ncbi:uncharacterized protein LOC134348437 [Mobula hypostoma]|uniref:uncharacterized protein LOC134348437 n=1 Tax=Mobula hypostoma TaxID=723540 RepID=UPI002FC3B8AC
MGSTVPPIVANLYMKEVEKTALNIFHGTSPSQWFRYVGDTWDKIKIHEVQAVTKYINSVDNNIKFTLEDVENNRLDFLDCAILIKKKNGQLDIKVYRKLTHTDQCLWFDSHHPLELNLGVIRTLHHHVENVHVNITAKDKELKYLKEALKAYGYLEWAFIKTATKNSKDISTTDRGKEQSRQKNVVIPYVAGISEKLRRIFNKHQILVFFKPTNTLRKKLVYPKDPTPKHKQSNIVNAIQSNENCTDVYISETKQLLHKQMAQQRRANSSGQDLAVYLYLKDKGRSFDDNNMHILHREDSCGVLFVPDAGVLGDPESPGELHLHEVLPAAPP